MKVFSVITFIFTLSLLKVKGVPTPLSPEESSLPAALDTKKLLEPNPPVSHNVEFTLEYLDKATGKMKEHEILIEIYGALTPKAASNFGAMASGVRVKLNRKTNNIRVARYKNSLIGEIVANKYITAGNIFSDFGGFSIFGKSFEDESLLLKHDRPGRVSLVSHGGPDTNNSEFMITTGLEPQVEFDGKNVVFGQVVRGLDVLLNDIQYLQTGAKYVPVSPVKILYVVPNRIMRDDILIKQREFLKNIEAFRNGDLSLGTTLSEMLASNVLQSNENRKIVPKAQENTHLQNILMMLSIISLLFSAYRYKKTLFSFIPESSKSLFIKSNE